MGQHGIVVLLTEDGQHLSAGLSADERSLCHLRKQRGVVPGRRGAEVVVNIKVERVVQDGVGKAHLPDAGVDGVQPQIVDDHVGSDVVGADDHHGGGVFNFQTCAHAQRPEHTGTVHKVLGLVSDFFLEAGFAPAGLQIQGCEDICLDGGSRLKFLVSADFDRVAVQIVHKDAHLALIGIQLGGNTLFQRHVFIHFGISMSFYTLFRGFLRRTAGRCGRKWPLPRPR